MQSRAVGAEATRVRLEGERAARAACEDADRERKGAEAKRAELAKLRRVSRKDKEKIPGLRNPGAI
jgi:hypothetical protein